MQAKQQRNIQSGAAYEHLFPRVPKDTYSLTIKKNAGVADTVAFIPKVVQHTQAQTKALAQLLKGKTLNETCSNIWHFVYTHIRYQKDEDGYEQVRSPSRIWHDRKQGVDCDCYSTFISSILYNLNIPHLLRITKYGKDYYQHIYPVVPNGAKEIILDCVTDEFDYEVPFTHKKDFTMDLQYLNGLDDANSGMGNITQSYSDSDGLAELGRIIKKKMEAKKSGKAPSRRAQRKMAAQAAQNNQDPNAVPSSGVKKKRGLKKILNIANKINPATVLLRNGVLASMKLNIGRVASRLRWSYLSPNSAKAKGIDMARFNKVVTIRQKLENIFYGAGGKPENLKNAILKGKGNKDKAVNGLGYLFGYEDELEIRQNQYYNTKTPLAQLLGQDIFNSENVEGMEGFEGFDGIEGLGALGELGEPATIAAITAASGVIAALAGMLKNVGDIFGGKGKGSEDFDESTAKEADKEIADIAKSSSASGGAAPQRISSTATDSGSSTTPDTTSSSGDSGIKSLSVDTPKNDAVILPSTDSDKSVTTTDDSSKNNQGGSNTKDGFWAKNKKWLLPLSIGVGGITLLAIGYAALKPKPSNKSNNTAPTTALQGVNKNKNHQRKTKGKNKGKKRQLGTIELPD